MNNSPHEQPLFMEPSFTVPEPLVQVSGNELLKDSFNRSLLQGSQRGPNMISASAKNFSNIRNEFL